LAVSGAVTDVLFLSFSVRARNGTGQQCAQNRQLSGAARAPRNRLTPFVHNNPMARRNMHVHRTIGVCLAKSPLPQLVPAPAQIPHQWSISRLPCAATVAPVPGVLSPGAAPGADAAYHENNAN
jgi:hypothetical protein